MGSWIARSGRVTVKVAPSPGAERASIVPPMASTSRLLM